MNLKNKYFKIKNYKKIFIANSTIYLAINKTIQLTPIIRQTKQDIYKYKRISIP